MSTKVEELREWIVKDNDGFPELEIHYNELLEAALKEEYERGRKEGEASLVGEYECAEILSDGSAILKKLWSKP